MFKFSLGVDVKRYLHVGAAKDAKLRDFFTFLKPGMVTGMRLDTSRVIDIFAQGIALNRKG